MKCTVCQRGKPSTAFKYRKRTCDTCYKQSDSYRNGRDKYYRDTYGISLVEYETLLAYHAGKCWICGSKGGRRSLAVDHNHKNQRVRGLLCKRCNTTLGRYKDNPLTFRIMSVYLEDDGETARRITT